MIRPQHLPKGAAYTALRCFHDPHPKPMADFDASFLVQWEPPDAAWVWLGKGELNRALLRELLCWMDSHGVKTIKAMRSERRRIPGGVRQPDGSVWVDVAEMQRRYPFDTGFTPL